MPVFDLINTSGSYLRIEAAANISPTSSYVKFSTRILFCHHSDIPSKSLPVHISFLSLGVAAISFSCIASVQTLEKSLRRACGILGRVGRVSVFTCALIQCTNHQRSAEMKLADLWLHFGLTVIARTN